MPDPRDFLPQPPWEGPPVPTVVRIGQCYRDAWQFIKSMKKEEVWLVHGAVFAGIPLRWIEHAWVEIGEDVYEPQSDDLFDRDEFHQKFRAKEYKRYSQEDALILAVRTGHYGPWTEAEEQDKWLKKRVLECPSLS